MKCQPVPPGLDRSLSLSCGLNGYEERTTEELFLGVAQGDMGWGDLPALNRQDPQPAWQRKALGTRRAGIEEQRIAEPFGFRLMRVAEDADIGPFPIQERSPLVSQLSAFIHDVPDRHALPA